MVGGSGRKFRRRSSDAELAAEDVVVVVDLDALVGVEIEFDLRRRLERHREQLASVVPFTTVSGSSQHVDCTPPQMSPNHAQIACIFAQSERSYSSPHQPWRPKSDSYTRKRPSQYGSFSHRYDTSP